MNSQSQAIHAKYDGRADVLYVTIGQAAPCRYEEDDDGLVWRIDVNGVRYGVTIMDYHAYWSRRLGVLKGRIVETLHVTAPELNEALSNR
jgi:uncharacterized protein YuzE